jgi:Ser/Thr protein kinase RdoA (MazF antagonist)
MNISTIIKKTEDNLNVTVDSYSILGEGQCNTIFKIETNNQGYCLKLEKEEKPFDELNHISVEGSILEYLNENIDIVQYVPKLVVVNKKYYLYEYINGKSMKESFDGFSVDTQEDICKNIAKFHYLLEKAKKEDVLKIGVTEYKPERHKLGLEQHDLSILSRKNKDLITRAFRIYEDSIDSSLHQLLHNDAHDENIFIRNNKVIFIDFGDMIWRDVHYDFYNYVIKYPNHWESIVNEFENLSGQKINRKRIVSIALLRYLRSFLEELKEPSRKTSILQKFQYIEDLLEKYC